MFNAPEAKAYPDFIGYSYSSCITCHYSGHGGGALNDYGRALFATEITARDVFSKRTDEEEIAARSGFLGKSKLPWWVRPGLKYRGLWLQYNPNRETTQRETYYNMQQDLNMTFFFDKKQKFTLVTTAAYTGQEQYFGKQNTIFAKEYYLRYKYSNNFWVYLGQIDKVYGLRNADHTAVNRSNLGLNQWAQSEGIITHWTYPDWDVAINAFVGNGNQPEADKQKGFSVSGEYQLQEKVKVGASALTSESENLKYNLVGLTTRMGLSKGSALMAEAGLKETTNLRLKTDPVLGSYALVQTLVNVRRGYNILSAVEMSKTDINSASAESMRWSVGGLFFPFPRTELRLMGSNYKTFSDTGGSPDAWALQSQIHISY